MEWSQFFFTDKIFLSDFRVRCAYSKRIVNRKECVMNKIIKAIIVGFVCAGSVFAVEAKSTYRDAQGRIQGSKK